MYAGCKSLAESDRACRGTKIWDVLFNSSHNAFQSLRSFTWKEINQPPQTIPGTVDLCWWPNINTLDVCLMHKRDVLEQVLKLLYLHAIIATACAMSKSCCLGMPTSFHISSSMTKPPASLTPVAECKLRLCYGRLEHVQRTTATKRSRTDFRPCGYFIPQQQ